MTDSRYKYAAINQGYTSMAANLERSLASLRRSLNGKDTKKVMVEAANVYDLTKDLLKASKRFIESVGQDSKALSEGAELRDIITTQGELILGYMNSDKVDEVKSYQDLLDKHRSFKPI